MCQRNQERSVMVLLHKCESKDGKSTSAVVEAWLWYHYLLARFEALELLKCGTRSKNIRYSWWVFTYEAMQPRGIGAITLLLLTGVLNTAPVSLAFLWDVRKCLNRILYSGWKTKHLCWIRCCGVSLHVEPGRRIFMFDPRMLTNTSIAWGFNY